MVPVTFMLDVVTDTLSYQLYGIHVFDIHTKPNYV